MGKYVLGGLAVAVLALVAFLVTMLRSPAAPAGEAPEDRIEVKTPATQNDAASSGASSRVAVAGPTPTRLRHIPDEEEVGYDGMNMLIGQEVPQKVLAAAGACYQDEEGRDERMELEYTLYIQAGTVTIKDVKLVESNMNNSRLEGCVVDTLRKLTWRDFKAPNLIEEMQISISILDLRKRAPLGD